jgi:hypothetical protein
VTAGRLSTAALASILFTGCAAHEPVPPSTATRVDLNRSNYRVVHADVTGQSFGFSVLGFIPVWSPSYTAAMTSLYGEASLTEGKPQALINVVQERSQIYLILFSVPTLTVRADIIEFTRE